MMSQTSVHRTLGLMNHMYNGVTLIQLDVKLLECV
jgi:hypothetical protein